jgi:uncharacterized damage-inducible protein DinB
LKKTKFIPITLVLLACASAALGQADKKGQQRNITEALDSWIAHTETLLISVAELMPESKYSFAPPTTFGEFKGVRTFAQQVKHLAANNYGMAALIQGDRRTAEMVGETGPDSAKTKTEIMDYLKGSFAALHRAVATIDEKNATEQVASPSEWQKTRLSFAVDAVTHSMDHYGQMVEYLRMNGLIPPESQPKKP